MGSCISTAQGLNAHASEILVFICLLTLSALVYIPDRPVTPFTPTDNNTAISSLPANTYSDPKLPLVLVPEIIESLQGESRVF